MSETESTPPEKFEEFRKKALPDSPVNSRADALAPPQHWIEQLYENEYKPLPEWVKGTIKYVILILALSIAMDHATRHTRSSLCQWGWGDEHFCEDGQTPPK